MAVKLVKPGMDSRQVLARFEAERQALALMDHPNIARVLDAGATPIGPAVLRDGTGQGGADHKLLRRAPARGAGAAACCSRDVCRAVQHAHQKGVIHRDLKPSNVLVAPYDGRPVVKVIDFGVAKAVGQPLTDQTLVTGLGAVVGTPEYMSPEQAELNNLDIDTRSDIYALGVLLYELLTGTTPLTRRRVKEAALLEVLRVIREEEPPRPSTRLSRSTESLPSISAQRQTEPAQVDEAGARRAGLDRDEGAGEGPQPALRDGQRPGDGCPALPDGRAGAGVPAVGVVPAAEVRPAEQGAADRGGRRVPVPDRRDGHRHVAGGPRDPGGARGPWPASGWPATRSTGPSRR